LGFAACNKFEQNVCKALKVRESQKFAYLAGEFSTGFSTDYVENFDGTAARVGTSPQMSVGAS
jgi:hypothetical protein